jgi:LacI family transcriptional regulator
VPERTGSPATLADVARIAGVSPATVSRVLNGNYPVSKATAARVESAVAELSYVVNGNARALAAATSDLVGIVVNDVADPFFGLIASGIQDETGGADVLAIIGNTNGEPDRELRYLTLLRRQRARAVVLTGGTVDEPGHLAALTKQIRALADAGCAVVQCGRPPLADTPGVSTVDFDNRGGAYALTSHLISLGHRKIGYISGPADRTTTRLRLRGHRQAMADHGLDGPVLSGVFSRATGENGAAELLQRDGRLTALVAGNDTIALGACTFLHSQGLSVPDDISVCGYDDLPYSADAALTTVRLPLTEAGRIAGRIALGQQPAPSGGVFPIGAELVIRTSTAPPR